MHGTQFHQKLASCWAHVVEILSWVRELEHGICKINVFLKAKMEELLVFTQHGLTVTYTVLKGKGRLALMRKYQTKYILIMCKY